MHWLAKTLIQTLFSWWFKRQKDSVIGKAKIEGLKVYLRVLQGTRWTLMGLISLLVFLQFLSFGLAMMVGAGIFLFPLEIETKLWIVFSAGAVLFFLPLFVLLIAFSEKLWYRLSGAQKLVENSVDFSK